MRPTRRSRYFADFWALAFCLACAAAEGAEPSPVASAPSLDTVVVAGRKISVQTLIDRKVYTVSSDPQATFGAVSDVLSAIPSVDVDPDGQVSLRGDSNILVLIDGKPSTQFAGAAAGENLQSMSAMDIERVEVITNPPAQFKADGVAGVINIITRKKHPDGTSASLQGSLGSGGRSIVGANASYKSGPLTASITAGFRHDYRDRLRLSNVRSIDPSTRLTSASDSVVSERIVRQVPTVGLSAEYALNDRQSVSGTFSWTRRGGLRTYSQLSESSDASGALTTAAQRLSLGHDPQSSYDERLGYTQKLGREGEEIALSLHRSMSRQHEVYDYTNQSLVPLAALTFSNLGFREDHATTELGVDYALPFSTSRSLKLGYAFEQADFRFANAGNSVDPLTGAEVPDPNLNNDFKFRQQIHAVYVSYRATIGDWNGLAGLRAEQTRTAAQQLTDHVLNSTSYFKLYPSLHVDRSLSDRATLSFAASQRVSRPDPSDLNPYIDHEYTPNLAAGNPTLRPQYTLSYEIGYGFEGKGLAYQVTGYYRRSRDSVTDVTDYLGNGFSLTTKSNLPKNNSAGVEITSDGHITAKLASSVSANLIYNQIDASALGRAGLQSSIGVNAKLKLDYRATSADSAQLIVTRTDKRLTPQGYISAVNIVNIGYKRQLKPDLTTVVTVADVFNGQRNQRLESTPAFSGDYRRYVRGRVLYVGLVYSFGSTKNGKPASLEYDPSD